MKLGRNQLCYCGSGKKFKRCHGSYDAQQVRDAEASRIFAQAQASERIRQSQQGLGRPILSTTLADRRLVFVKNRVFHSQKWKTVPDFLGDYIKLTLGPEWGNKELTKPFEQRHPIIQWYYHYCKYQEKTIPKPGEVHNSPITGVVACYLGLAYSLYLLAHNLELQGRLVRRLKDPGNFQGAYYELIVANSLIRAGFTLELEDETDGNTKHCEFSAVSKATGKKYWVEAKMRAVAGLLGRTEQDGTTSEDPLSRLTHHLTAALAKPAKDERLIFVDLNTPYDPALFDKPEWLPRLRRTLEKYERRHRNERAYVIVTNTPFHRMLGEAAPIMGLPFGIGMPDLNRPGYYRLSEAYLNKRKHVDIYNICDALEKYLSFPSTFDGSLPSEAFYGAQPIRIGETYVFPDSDNLVGTVADVTVDDVNKVAYVMVNSQDGKCAILKEQMSDAAFDDYKRHPDAYFGKVKIPQRVLNSKIELFEWFMEVHENTPRAKIMEHLSKYPPPPGGYGHFNDEELRAIYCEGLAAMVPEPTVAK